MEGGGSQYLKMENKNGHKASQVKCKQEITRAKKELEEHLGIDAYADSKKLCKYSKAGSTRDCELVR